MYRFMYLSAFLSVFLLTVPAQANDSENRESPPPISVLTPDLDEDWDSLSSPLPTLPPDEAINQLSAKSGEWHEPSPASEEMYVQAIRQWLSTLPPAKRKLTREILREAHPVMHDLRMAIREKKAELSSLNFDQNMRPETLPRLGQELQTLRNSLRVEMDKLGFRLRDEAGVTIGPLDGDSFWLAPPLEAAEENSVNEELPNKLKSFYTLHISHSVCELVQKNSRNNHHVME